MAVTEFPSFFRLSTTVGQEFISGFVMASVTIPFLTESPFTAQDTLIATNFTTSIIIDYSNLLALSPIIIEDPLAIINGSGIHQSSGSVTKVSRYLGVHVLTKSCPCRRASNVLQERSSGFLA